MIAESIGSTSTDRVAKAVTDASGDFAENAAIDQGTKGDRQASRAEHQTVTPG
jgi:hypothetical protein